MMQRTSLLCRQLLRPILTDTRPLTLSAVSRIKEITRQEEGDKIVIEAHHKPSPREKYLVNVTAPKPTPASKSSSAVSTATSQGQGKCECCLCRLGLHIQHTDVLILKQFTDSKGKLLHRTITKLCWMQNKRVEYLLVMAEKAGLMDRYTRDGSKRELEGWEKFNKYYDENVIEEFVHKTTRRFRA